MSNPLEIGYSYTPASMKQILETALSPITTKEAQRTDEDTMTYISEHRDSREAFDTKSNDLPLTPTKSRHFNPENTLFSPLIKMDESPPIPPSSSPALPITRNEYTPLLRRTIGTASYNLSPFSSPIHQPNNPSPLRNVTTRAEHSSSPLPQQDTSSFSSPIRPLGNTTGTERESGSYSSPIRPLSASGEEKSYQVEASFLQAMIGLLERQANIIPEHLFTESDVQQIVRQELQNHHQPIIHDAHWQGGGRLSLSSVVTVPGVIIAMMTGAGLEVFRRLWIFRPEEVGWYAGGAVKGGFVGLVSAMVAKGCWLAVDWLRGTWDV